MDEAATMYENPTNLRFELGIARVLGVDDDGPEKRCFVTANMLFSTVSGTMSGILVDFCPCPGLPGLRGSSDSL